MLTLRCDSDIIRGELIERNVMQTAGCYSVKTAHFLAFGLPRVSQLLLVLFINEVIIIKYFYDINKALSYSKLFYFIVGGRSCGKTYSFKKWAIKSFLKTGSQFIYLRRYETDFKKIELFFDDILANNEFECQFKVSANIFYINEKVAGYYFPLTSAQSLKSTPFPNVGRILLDEFILEDGFQHYIPNEVSSTLSLYDTISRDRDIPMLFMSNAVKFNNPYFNYFALNKGFNKDISIFDDIYLEIITNKHFIEQRKQTRFGKMISNTSYSQYAIENKFTDDDNTFVSKKQKTAIFKFTMIWKGQKIGVWADYTIGYWCLSDDVDPSNKIIYTLSISDHQENALLLTSIKNNIMFKNMIRAFDMGLLIFETQKLKSIFYEIIRRI